METIPSHPRLQNSLPKICEWHPLSIAAIAFTTSIVDMICSPKKPEYFVKVSTDDCNTKIHFGFIHMIIKKKIAG
jgi:hypothetical protein